MYPYIEIFGKTVSGYGLMAVTGIIAVFIYSAINCKITKKSMIDRTYFIAFCLVFLFLGATTLYQLTNIKTWIKVFPYLFTDFDYAISQLSFGLVFYGGLIGVFIGAMVYSKTFKQDCRDMVYHSVPAIALFQIFGRIGCFLAGCCHGRVSEKYGIAYTHAEHTLNGVPYLPVQLYESAMNLVLFIFLLIYEKVNKGKEKCYQAMGLYLIPYGVFRFIIEFFRGDAIRGIFGGLSTSQWISLFVVPFGIYCLIVPEEKNILNHWYVPRKKEKEI